MSLKSFTAFTNEVDDVDAAVSEILAQLDLDGSNTLLAHAVGIVSCYAEYVESGVWAALCEKLPFEVIGVTTIANMTAGQLGEAMLCLMVLTSDEVCFAAGLSAPITAQDAGPLKSMAGQALEKLPGKPSLMLSFAPLCNNFSSDFYVESMTEIMGDVPNFGALAVDHNPDYHDSQVLLNGEGYKDRFAILLLCGPVEPKFYVGVISNERIFADKSVVTDSNENQLKMVDDAPVIAFLQSLGLSQNEDGTIAGINAFPLIVDYNDGTTPVARAMFATTPEGYAVCGGNIPVGATLSVGTFDEAEIVATTRRILGEVLESGRHTALLMYSCIGRYFAQGYNTAAEFSTLIEPLKQSGVSHLVAYSGGELCPVHDAGGKIFNRNHNNAFIVCGF